MCSRLPPVFGMGQLPAQIYAKFAADHADLDFSAVIETLRGS